MHSEIQTFASVELPIAERILSAESEMTISGEDAALVAGRVEREPPALRWAARLARTMGWRPLCERLGDPSFLFRASPPPWQADVTRIRAELDRPTRDLLSALSGGGGGFTWEVLERVVGQVEIESLVRLEEAGLLVRLERAGVVAFKVPFCVRALQPADMRPWIRAWNDRARELASRAYGRDAKSTLAELAYALPIAERALEHEVDGGAELFVAAADAIFFEAALDYESPSFDRAVAQAEDRVVAARARLILARASLERGNPARAGELVAEARGLATEECRAEILRSEGWIAIADGRVPDALSAFEAVRAHGDVRSVADADAGLGVVALVLGDPARAREHLERSFATHVVMGDEPRRRAVENMMALLPVSTDANLGELEARALAARSSGNRWREALAFGQLGVAARRQGEERAAENHLREARIAAEISKMPVADVARRLVDPTTFVVANEARRFTFDEGTHDLTRHGPLRRLLWTLAVERVERPGRAIGTFDLVSAAWPEEKIRPQAATLRLYTTMKRLRQLGLERLILTRPEGYLIDPEIPVRIED